MTIPTWPPGTFRWLSQLFDAAVNEDLIAEGQAIIELIVAVAPHFRGRPLLDGLLLHQTQRYQEASESLVEALKADPQCQYARYVLFMSLLAMDNPDWVQHAQALAASSDEGMSALALQMLADAGWVHASAASASTEPAPPAFHNILVRV